MTDAPVASPRCDVEVTRLVPRCDVEVTRLVSRLCVGVALRGEATDWLRDTSRGLGASIIVVSLIRALTMASLQAEHGE